MGVKLRSNPSKKRIVRHFTLTEEPFSPSPTNDVTEIYWRSRCCVVTNSRQLTFIFILFVAFFFFQWCPLLQWSLSPTLLPFSFSGVSCFDGASLLSFLLLLFSIYIRSWFTMNFCSNKSMYNLCKFICA